MSTTKPITSEPILYLIAGVMAIGGVVSAYLTTDPRWMEWHLSRLGEGGRVSSYIFNISSALCSLMMGELARRLLADLNVLSAPQNTLKAARRLLGGALGAVAVCMMGVAVFPFDRFPAVHNTFGYSMTVVYVTLVAWLPLVLPVFTRAFVAATYGFIATMALLFGVYFATNQHMPQLIYIEILGLLFFFVWMMMLVKSLRVHNRAIGKNSTARAKH